MHTHRNAVFTFWWGVVSICVCIVTFIFRFQLLFVPFPIQLLYFIPALVTLGMGGRAYLSHQEEEISQKTNILLVIGVNLGFLCVVLYIIAFVLVNSPL